MNLSPFELGIRVVDLQHDFPFDPTYGRTLGNLLKETHIHEEPDDFDEFWENRHTRALVVEPKISMIAIEPHAPGRKTFRVRFSTSEHSTLAGWIDIPSDGRVERGLVMLHGYGGRPEGPDPRTFLDRCAVISPGLRGLPPSGSNQLPSDAWRHVLHGIENRDSYLPGWCVDDVWCATSALAAAVPEAAEEMYLVGPSFGGGVGLLALAFDSRFRKAFFSVPTFGNHPLRLTLPSVGSGEPLRKRWTQDPSILDVHRYFDSSVAARRVERPVFVSAALFDPSVPPPGQFAAHNALGGERFLFVKKAGHFEYPDGAADEEAEFERVTSWLERENNLTGIELAPSLRFP